MSVVNCNFTGTVSGQNVLAAEDGAVLSFGGTIVYNASSTVASFVAAQVGSIVGIGYQDIYSTNSVHFTFQGAPVFSLGFALAETGGTVYFYPAPVTWGGASPTGPQYRCQSAGGIYTLGGSLVLPGNQPGQVYTPGWTQ
jgi:hypothetical protein